MNETVQSECKGGEYFVPLQQLTWQEMDVWLIEADIVFNRAWKLIILNECD